MLFDFRRCNKGLEIQLRKEVHDMNKDIFFVCWFSKALVLQILEAVTGGIL